MRRPAGEKLQRRKHGVRLGRPAKLDEYRMGLLSFAVTAPFGLILWFARIRCGSAPIVLSAFLLGAGTVAGQGFLAKRVP